MAEKAKTTIEILVANMVNPMIMNQIFFKRYREISGQNNLMLLYRAKKLYEARELVTIVLKSIVEVEVTMNPKCRLWCIMLDSDKKTPLNPIFRNEIDAFNTLISRSITQIDSFKEQNKLFKG